MKKLFIVSISILLMIMFSSNGICEENKFDYNHTAENYYNLYKSYKKVYIDKIPVDKETFIKSHIYYGYIKGFLDTCPRDPNCNIEYDKNYTQYAESIGQYLEKNPLERNEHIQTLLLLWEKETFGVKEIE